MSDVKHVVPEKRKALYLGILEGIGTLDSKWDTVIADGKLCIIVDGAKVINNEARKECAADFVLVAMERDSRTDKASDHKEYTKTVRTVFSNGITRRMRPDAKIRQKDGKQRAAPWAGWKVPTERAPKAPTVAAIAAIAVPVASLRPLTAHALSAANDVTTLLAAFQAEAKLSKAQIAACGMIAEHALTVVNRVKAIEGLLPEVSDDPGKAMQDATNALAGNGAEQPAA